MTAAWLDADTFETVYDGNAVQVSVREERWHVDTNGTSKAVWISDRSFATAWQWNLLGPVLESPDARHGIERRGVPMSGACGHHVTSTDLVERSTGTVLRTWRPEVHVWGSAEWAFVLDHGNLTRIQWAGLRTETLPVPTAPGYHWGRLGGERLFVAQSFHDPIILDPWNATVSLVPGPSGHGRPLVAHANETGMRIRDARGVGLLDHRLHWSLQVTGLDEGFLHAWTRDGLLVADGGRLLRYHGNASMPPLAAPGGAGAGTILEGEAYIAVTWRGANEVWFLDRNLQLAHAVSFTTPPAPAAATPGPASETMISETDDGKTARGTAGAAALVALCAAAAWRRTHR